MRMRLRTRTMRRRTLLVLCALAFTFLGVSAVSSQGQGGGNAVAAGSAAEKSNATTWKFAVSGDSRNCGDVVMPGIAAGVAQRGAVFYWHLGDFRRITGIDEDIQHQPEHLKAPVTVPEYYDMAWKDFIDNQIVPFGNLQVYLGIGNHEAVAPMTHAEYLAQFAKWLDAPNLRAQRLRDDPSDLKAKTYYHWSIFHEPVHHQTGRSAGDGVDFISLDNAANSEFDAEQIAWFEKTLLADSVDSRIRTIVVGMHEALPESISKSHSMNQSAAGTESGRRVYADLLKAQDDARKRVYVLASHSHYFMDGIYNTDYWHEHGGVLPGWIIGTAGAVRYPLPKGFEAARTAQTDVYGFLMGAVHSDGGIEFAFEQLSEKDIPPAVVQRYTPEFVHWCFVENSRTH
jgi:hypothetical protein